MAHSGRERHRDRAPGSRQFADTDVQGVDRIFKITDAERRQIVRCLRFIDESRRALESQHNADNREIIRELRASADRIYELIKNLEEADDIVGRVDSNSL
jgi:hypothetical protein